MNHIVAMKQALEALYPISHNSTDDYRGQADKAITTLRTAVDAGEKQEPVACIRSLTDQCAALIQERDELQKQVWRYEKHGVTCQTYGHKVESSCSECNVHEDYTTPPATPVQKGN